MADTVVIDIVANFEDRTKGVEAAQKKLDGLVSSAKKLGKTKFSVDVNAKDNSFHKKMEKAEQRAEGFKKTRAEKVLDAIDKASRVINKVSSAAKAVSGKAWSITLKAKDLVTAPIRKVLGILRNPMFAAGAVLGISVGLKDTVDTYKDFEAAMSQVQAISGATAPQLAKLSDKASEMGATTKFTAKESAEAFNYMAMAGWKTEDMLGGIEGILNLAAASGEALATTSDIVTDALTAFGLKAGDSGHFADVLAAAASNANTTVSGMGETFKYVGTMAGSLGYSIEDVSLAVGLMANSGLKGSMAGTALNSVLTRLSTNANGARTAIEELGVKFYKSDGTARKFGTVMGELRAATAGFTQEQKAAFANTVAGTEAQKGLLAVLNASQSDYDKLSDAINHADGAAKNMSETMLDNLQGSLTLLGSAVDGAKKAFGERLSPYIRGAADWLTGMVPAIESALDSFMDRVDSKVEKIKTKFRGITLTDDWQNADLFGKARILWDDFIAEPFAEWWSGRGKAKLAGIARDAGTSIGTGISAGISTLLGIDGPGAAEEGLSIGQQFAEGFLQGFEGLDIAGALGKTVSKLFSNAGKLLPGGEKADLSSLMSAGLLAKFGIPLLGAGINGVKIGADIYRSAKSGKLSKLIGSATLSENLDGSGIAGGTGLLGLFGKTGKALRSGATTAGGLSTVGGGAIAGGLAAGATLLSGANDLYAGFKSEDKQEKKYYYAKGGTKLAGVGAGAAAGAALGSVVPVIGTAAGALIGAGVGGLAGWFASGKVADKIAGTADAAKKYGEDAAEAARKTEELKKRQEKLAKTSLDKHFGDIALSAGEMDASIRNVFGTKRMEEIEKTTASITQMKQAYESFREAGEGLKKSLWMAGIKDGAKLASEEVDSLKASVKAYSDSAKQYLTDSQYAATQSVELLMGNSKEARSLVESTDQYYSETQGKLSRLTGKLEKTMNIALADGKISLDVELPKIEELRAKIASLTAQLAKEDFEADLNILKAKYGEGDLSAEDFGKLMSGAQETAAQNAEGFWDSYGAASVGKSEEEIRKLQKGLYDNLSRDQLKAGSLGLDTIREQYGKELGTLGKDVSAMLSENTGFDILKATGGLSEDTRAAVGTLIEQMAPTTEQIQGLADKYKSLGVKVPDAITEYLNSASLYEAVAQGTSQVKEWLSSQNIEAEPLVSLNPELQVEDINGDGIVTWLEHQLQTPLSPTMPVNPEYEFKNTDTSALVSSFISRAQKPVTASVNVNADYLLNKKFEASQGVDKNYAEDTSVDVNADYHANRFDVRKFINDSYRTSTTVTVDVDYKQTGGTFTPKKPGSPVKGFRGGVFGSQNIPGFSNGGMVAGGGQFIKVAEEGDPEMVIPLGRRRKKRGMELWQKAGEYLGVRGYAAQGFATGGLAGGSMAPLASVPMTTGSSGIRVDIGNVTVNVPVSGGNDVMAAVRENLEAISDEIAGEILAVLSSQFANTPARA